MDVSGGQGSGQSPQEGHLGRDVAPRDPGKEHPGLSKELELTSEQQEACKVPPLSQPWRGKLFLLKLFESYCKTTPKIKTLFIILPLLRQ